MLPPPVIESLPAGCKSIRSCNREIHWPLTSMVHFMEHFMEDLPSLPHVVIWEWKFTNFCDISSARTCLFHYFAFLLLHFSSLLLSYMPLGVGGLLFENLWRKFDSFINFLTHVYVNITMFVQFKFSKIWFSFPQRQSYVFSLLTRPESIVSCIGFRLADWAIASTGWNPIFYYPRTFRRKSGDIEIPPVCPSVMSHHCS